MFKFAGLWLAVMLVFGAILFFVNGSTDALDPTLETERLANCEGAGGGFSGNQAQECLTQVQRSLESLVDDTQGDIAFWHALTGLAVLVIGLVFVFQIVARGEKVGDPAGFRSMRGAWFGHALTIVIVTIGFAVLAHFSSYFGNWGQVLAPARGWGFPAMMVVVWLITFWLGTRISTPEKMKPSIPGG
ncbi:hypothetical protein [Aurantiacibacter sediminis]|uniref:Uncharacterized protein n=1 Tax=Aurantiacibacter sediminis TaxID=2793064 RepID=A0ABS0N691_9SPHN|nr:hypothetical protein [Aurantiacibacter sediminis]MBH5323306.1 hypothetical protein [Aurantiacibacter sediminis]